MCSLCVRVFLCGVIGGLGLLCVCVRFLSFVVFVLFVSVCFCLD